MINFELILNVIIAIVAYKLIRAIVQGFFKALVKTIQDEEPEKRKTFKERIEEKIKEVEK